MQTVKKLLFLLSPYERKQAVLLLIMTMVMALLEMIGVASILPFIAVLSNPDIVNTNIILNTTYKTSVSLGLIEGYRQFSFFLGILMFILLVF